MEKYCEMLNIKNDIGDWLLPKQFTPESLGGDNPGVHGVIGLTAIGKTHSDHIVEALSFALWLKGTVTVIDNKAIPNRKIPPPTIIDAGAHIGTISIGISQALSQLMIDSTIYAVELLPELYICLTHNLQKNMGSYTDVHVINAALTSPQIANHTELVNVPSLCEGWNFKTDKATAGCFSYSLIGNDDQTKTNQVPTTTIDTIFKDKSENITAIKVDCEGTDLDVLKGAYNTIQKFRPVILFEDTDRDKASFIVDKKKSTDQDFWIHAQNLLNDNVQTFFNDIEYRVFRNWMYTSWEEYIAIPNEDLEKAAAHCPFMHEFLPADHFFFNVSIKPDKEKKPAHQLALCISSVLEAWGDNNQTWLENNEIKNMIDLENYAERLLEC